MLFLKTTPRDSGGERRGKAGKGRKQQQRRHRLQTENQAPRELLGEPKCRDAAAAHWLLPPRAAQQRAREENGGGRLPARMRAPCSTPPLHPHSPACCSPCPAQPSIDPNRGHSGRQPKETLVKQMSSHTRLSQQESRMLHLHPQLRFSLASRKARLQK